MQSLKAKAKDKAQRAAFVSSGALFCLAGLAFLTLAGWFFLLTLMGPLEAALVLAGVYFGIGLILVGLGLRREAPEIEEVTEEDVPVSDAPPIMQAFLYGMQAGAKAGSGRD